MAQFRAVPLSVGMFVPEQVWSNEKLATMMDTTDEWIQSRTGIKERRIVEPGVATSDLAVKASKIALENASIKPDDIDLILAATLSPDFYFPGIGPIIQTKLGMGPIPALDIRGQCAGFTWSLSAAESFAGTGKYKKILIVGAEVHSNVISWDNFGRDIAVLFGDGAGAMVLQVEDDGPATVENGKSGIIDHIMGSDGAGAEHLIMKRPGMAGQERFVTQQDLDEKTCHPTMDGRYVFKNAVQRMTQSVLTLLERHNLTVADIDLIVPHQANLRINEAIRERLGCPPEKVVNIIHQYGNTTAATIPMAMNESVAQGKLKKGNLIVSVAFGAGFAWGANLIRW